MDPNGHSPAQKAGSRRTRSGGDDVIGPSRARDVLSRIGWLSRQPEEFQSEVFKRAAAVKFAAGEVIYRLGDPVGGIYGIVTGAVVANAAPRGYSSHILHVLAPGGWTGEAPFLSREPRRIGLTAAIETTAVYLPLDAMDQMAGRDPMATRRFTQILLINLDILLRAFYELQDPDEHRRIALTLRRITVSENTPIPLTQSALGILSNTSRKTVNAAMRRFVEAGWIKTAYRTFTIKDMKALSRFADSGAD
jgi:CRP/FNR family transcriptional regulator, cyclic AMP receptor protein